MPRAGTAKGPLQAMEISNKSEQRTLKAKLWEFMAIAHPKPICDLSNKGLAILLSRFVDTDEGRYHFIRNKYANGEEYWAHTCSRETVLDALARLVKSRILAQKKTSTAARPRTPDHAPQAHRDSSDGDELVQASKQAIDVQPIDHEVNEEDEAVEEPQDVIYDLSDVDDAPSNEQGLEELAVMSENSNSCIDTQLNLETSCTRDWSPDTLVGSLAQPVPLLSRPSLASLSKRRRQSTPIEDRRSEDEIDNDTYYTTHTRLGQNTNKRRRLNSSNSAPTAQTTSPRSPQPQHQLLHAHSHQDVQESQDKVTQHVIQTPQPSTDHDSKLQLPSLSSRPNHTSFSSRNHNCGTCCFWPEIVRCVLRVQQTNCLTRFNGDGNSSAGQQRVDDALLVLQEFERGFESVMVMLQGSTG